MEKLSQNSDETHKCIKIDNVEISFPKEPYACQVDYMRCAIRALNNSQNSLLESPTGTGKTLSLLCSTLAWQLRITNELRLKSMHAKKELPGNIPLESKSVTSVIIYASRTHSQLAQVVKELKSTTYRPRMVVLGSRDQLCIHEKLSKLKGTALNNACSNLTAGHKCTYKNNFDMNLSSNTLPISPNAILDIEDLVKIGKAERFCPYYQSRETSTAAELILLPYNYLLDASMRSKIQVNWNNAVVIFDEAHNVEKVAADSASCSLTSTEIAQCIEELQNVIRILRNKFPESIVSKDTEKNGESSNNTTLPTDKSLPSNIPSYKDIAAILKSLFNMEKYIDEIPLVSGNLGNTPSAVMPGQWLRNMLEASGFKAHLVRVYTIIDVSLSEKLNILIIIMLQVFLYIRELQLSVSLLLQEAQDAAFGSSILENGVTLSLTEPKLSLLIKLLERVFRTTHLLDLNDYKVFICEKEKAIKNSGVGFHATNTSIGCTKSRVLNYWAFSPGIALEELKKLGVRSIIMTSGNHYYTCKYCDDVSEPNYAQVHYPLWNLSQKI